MSRFEQQAGGNPALMRRIALAFVDQLPGWRAEFNAAAERPDLLAPLLHKMKGSCHAISATEAAEAFEKAEKTLQALGFQREAGLHSMLVLLAEIEMQLQIYIDPPRARGAEDGTEDGAIEA